MDMEHLSLTLFLPIDALHNLHPQPLPHFLMLVSLTSRFRFFVITHMKSCRKPTATSRTAAHVVPMPSQRTGVLLRRDEGGRFDINFGTCLVYHNCVKAGHGMYRLFCTSLFFTDHLFPLTRLHM